MTNTVEVKIKVSGSARPYGVWMNGKAVRISNGNGSVSLTPQPEGQILMWFAEGSPGDTFKLSAKSISKEYANVDRKIPVGQQRIAGTKKFRVN